MGFLNPLALLLAALAGAIVVMYLLKLKRKREDFSSTLLWVKTVQDLTANAPFQKLRQNLLMYLQILTLLAIVFSLARPTMWLTRKGGTARIVMIDNSASMNATDAPPHKSRLEAAKAQAGELIDNMASGDQMMVLSFGGTARVAQPFTTEKGLLRTAIAAIEPTDATAHIQEAVLLAQGVRKVDKNAVMTIISDGGVGYLGNLLHEGDPVEFFRVGQSDGNQGIVAFDLRQSFEAQGEAQVFAEVENFASEPATVLLRCLINGELQQAKEAKIDAKGKQGFVFAGLGAGSNRMLRLELAPGDMLASDDAVNGLLDIDTSIRILIVTSGNFFLEQALALVPGAKVTKIAPADYLPTVAADVVVFDQYAPPALSTGHYLFLNSTPPLQGFAKRDAPLKDQAVVDWNRIHPVTRYANFEELFINEALDISIADWAVPLAESAQAPLVYAGENQGVRLAGIAFDLYATDWPLQISFPIFISNAVRWLAGAGEGSLSARHKIGETLRFQSATPIHVKGPSGELWTLQPDSEGVAYFNQTNRVGTYEADREGGVKEPFTVNLLSREESDITPKGEIISGEQKIVASAPKRQNREVWPWAAALGLLILTAEWHLYCRRSWL